VKIDITEINNLCWKLDDQSAELFNVLSSLLLLQRDLNAIWSGAEMIATNQVIEQHDNRLSMVISDLKTITGDILRVAEVIRMEQELAAKATMS